MRLHEHDLQHVFDRETLRKGAVLHANNQVLRLEFSPDGGRLTGTVQDTRSAPYNQTIIIKQVNGRHSIDAAHCTCPMGTHCKHTVAVLLRHLRSAAAPAGHAATPEPMLSPEVSGWLDRLAAASEPMEPAKPASPADQRALLYVLNYETPCARYGKMTVRLRPIAVRRRKDGSFTNLKPYNPELVLRPREQHARFISETDLEILRGLYWLSRTGINDGDVWLGGDPGSRHILEMLLETGRLRHGTVQGIVLQAGPPVPAEPRWIALADGAQKLTLSPATQKVANAPRFDAVLPLDPPYYLDLQRGLAGVIATELPRAIALEIARAPTVGPAEAPIVKHVMLDRLTPPAAPSKGRGKGGAGPRALPLPQAASEAETRQIAPVPHLHLSTTMLRVQPQYLRYAREGGRLQGDALPIARLAFNYGGAIVAHPSEDKPMLVRPENGRLILMPRDAKAEAVAVKRLTKLGLKPLRKLPLMAPPEQGDDFFLAPAGASSPYEFVQIYRDIQRFLSFSAEAVPELAAEGWQISYADDYPYRIVEEPFEWWADIGEGSGIDWFSFEMGIAFEEHRINLVPQLATMLATLPPETARAALMPEMRDDFTNAMAQITLYHTLPDGQLLPLPGERLAPILTALMALIGPRRDSLADGKLRLHRSEAGALASFAGETENITWAADAERLIALGERLRASRSAAPVTPPPSFKATLRPYQRDGLAWLDFLRECGFGGVLADDMGLGKTVQALAFLSREKADGRLDKPALIVVPTSVLPNWQAEAERFAPDIKVLSLHGLERKVLFGDIARHDLVLTTYPLLARDHETLLAHDFHSTILDEAQAIKNPKAAVTTVAHRLKARHRLALTGTPLENNLGEVWSLFEFLSPGLLGDESTFRRTFRTPIEKRGDVGAQAFLSRRLRPFMLRRTKEEVATELPPKTEIVEHVRLEGAQRDLYETVRALMHEKVRAEIAAKGLAKSHIVFLDALLKLRQVCCDPRLLKMAEARKVKGSAKLERLMEMVPELVGEGRRILIFSQFTSMLALIEDELKACAIPYVQLTGDTADRAAPVRQFQSGKAPVFLLSLKAGGTGLNLTAADTVIHYDPWWNPAVEAQATDRAYRIGQDKPVFVYKLIVEEGIEAAIERLKARKAALAEALFAGRAKAPLDLTEADIAALFAPLETRMQRRAA